MTVWHIFVDCMVARECWRLSGLQMDFSTSGEFSNWAMKNFKNIYGQGSYKCSDDDVLVFMVFQGGTIWSRTIKGSIIYWNTPLLILPDF